jgi:phosphoglycerate dehydrogenase-like enzyme
VWHHARVPELTVLEYHRDPVGVWNLPRMLMERVARDFPGVTVHSAHDPGERDARLPESDVVYGWGVTPRNFGTARRLRWVHVDAAGVRELMFPALVESPVVITNGRGIHGVAMAEHVLGVILAFTRRLHLARDAQREKRWVQRELWETPPGPGQLAGGTLGIVGFGAVGAALAPRAAALGLTVITVRRHPAADPAPAHEQWGDDRLDELVARADWLVLACALTPRTMGLMSRERIARLKPDAVVINVGRGALVDEPALIEALERGRIAGAGLDVTADEPLPEASPLWGMPQVILTPHISGLGPRYWERSVELFARNLRAFLDGAPLANVVDKRAGY